MTTPQLLKEIIKQEIAVGFRLLAAVEHHDPSRRWQGEGLNGKRVAYWSGGHIGDTVAHTAVTAELRWRYPAIELHPYCMGTAGNVFANSRDVEQAHAYSLAVPADEIASYDYVILPKPNPYLHRGRETNYYDELEAALGFTIARKRPYLYTTEQVRTAVVRWLSQNSGGHCPPMPFVLAQVAASQKDRTPRDWHPRLAAIAEAIPDHWFVVVGDADNCPDLIAAQQAEPLPRTIMALRGNGVELTPLPALIELARTASLVVTPDSLSGHIAAAWETPALWLVNTDGTPEERIPPARARIGTYNGACALSMDAPPDLVARIAQNVMRY